MTSAKYYLKNNTIIIDTIHHSNYPMQNRVTAELLCHVLNEYEEKTSVDVDKIMQQLQQTLEGFEILKDDLIKLEQITREECLK